MWEHSISWLISRFWKRTASRLTDRIFGNCSYLLIYKTGVDEAYILFLLYKASQGISYFDVLKLRSLDNEYSQLKIESKSGFNYFQLLLCMLWELQSSFGKFSNLANCNLFAVSNDRVFHKIYNCLMPPLTFRGLSIFHSKLAPLDTSAARSVVAIIILLNENSDSQMCRVNNVCDIAWLA